MIAVDTSVWVEYFRDKSSSVAPDLNHLLDEGEVLLPAPVWIELLVGARRQEQPTLRQLLSALPRPIPTKLTWKTVENWTLLATKKGKRFAMGDLLIAAIAAESGAKLWSLDNDFVQMAKIKLIQIY